jgi:Tol biopolymer transport system component
VGLDTLLVRDLSTGATDTMYVSGRIFRPRWSPNGRLILFGAKETDGNVLNTVQYPPPAIPYRRRDLASQVLRLTRNVPLEAFGSVLKYDWGLVSEAGVDYKIVTEITSGSLTRVALVLLRACYPWPKVLTNTALGASDCSGTQVVTNAEFSPSFSPDGKRVLFASNFAIGEVEVIVESYCPVADTTDPEYSLRPPLRADPVAVEVAGGVFRCNEYAVWSHGGTRMAIEASAEGGAQLWLRRMSDRNAVQLTAFSLGMARFFAVWAPDDGAIAVLERVASAVQPTTTVQRIMLVRGY